VVDNRRAEVIFESGQQRGREDAAYAAAVERENLETAPVAGAAGRSHDRPDRGQAVDAIVAIEHMF
jgi:hypothetical protein